MTNPTPTDWRALCAEQLPELRGMFERILFTACSSGGRTVGHIRLADRLIDAVVSWSDAALTQPDPISELVSQCRPLEPEMAEYLTPQARWRLYGDEAQPEPQGPGSYASFIVKHYSSDDRPSIKGNGFDGLEIGEDRQEAEEFINWINARLFPGTIRPAIEPVPLTPDAAFAIGQTGGPPSEAERLAFEAWMRGHSWLVAGKWNGTTYADPQERHSSVDVPAMQTRMLWAAWRDRAALGRPVIEPVPQQEAE